MEINFLRKFCSLFVDTEVPERFAMWGALSSISATLERRVWVDMNIFQIYPNTFIIFVADSGRMRKSTAISMVKKLLARTDPGPLLIAQKITPEGLINALRTTRNDGGKLMKETSGGVVVADELVQFLNKDAYQRGLGALLTELWDCPEKFEYRTRNREPEELSYSHLSLLGGTTVHNLRDAIPVQSMGDGFTSRCIFVYEDRRPRPIPRPTGLGKFREVEEELILHLQAISTMRGEITLSSEAEKYFDDEYCHFFDSDFYIDPRFEAYASRRDKHLLKVSMCLLAAEDAESLVLQRHHIEGAKVMLEDLESRLGAVFDRIIMTEKGSINDKVHRAILTAPEGCITRADLQRKFSHMVSAAELDEVIKTLKSADLIQIDTDTYGKLAYRALSR